MDNEQKYLFKASNDLPEIIQKAFNFTQVRAYNFKFQKNSQFMLDRKKFMMDFPFPDSSSKEYKNFDYTDLKNYLLPGINDATKRCPNCGALLMNSKKYPENCCNQIKNIKNHMVTFEKPPYYLLKMLESLI